MWLFRNLGLFVLPFLAAYFAHRRQLDRATMDAVGRAVRAIRGRRQRLPVRFRLGHRGARRVAPSGRAVVRSRLPIHARHDPSAGAAHGLRALHRRVGDLLRADRARRGCAARAHRPDPGADRSRHRRASRRVGAAVRRGRCGDRRGLARRVETARGREHGAGAHDAVHPVVRRDAGDRDGHLRRVRRRPARSTASCSASSTPCWWSCSASSSTRCRRGSHHDQPD